MEATPQENDAYALLIGVGDYRAFDASVGQPAGTSDLAGSTNDARALFRMCRLLRIPAANIRVLASPRLRPEDLGDGATLANLGDATREGILEGARWLAAKLDGPTRPTGILTYSGHGDHDDARGLLFCPTDTAGPELAGAIPFTELADVFASRACRKNLTVLLDCCNAGSARESVPTSRVTSLRGRALPPALAAMIPAISERMLCASAAGLPAYQARFDGEPRGAFSWAVSVAAEQWRLVQEGGNVHLTLSHRELIARAGALLAALSFAEGPVLVAPPYVGPMPVFQRGLVPHIGETSDDPTGARPWIQLTGDIKLANGADSDFVLYTLTLALPLAPVLLAEVLVTNTANPASGYAAQTEYWSVTSAGMANVSSATGLSITGVGGLWSDPPSFPVAGALPTFHMNEMVSWGTAPSASGPTLFVQPPPRIGPRVSLLWQLTYSSGAGWGGTLSWFQSWTTQHADQPTVLGGGTFSFSTTASITAPTFGVLYATQPLPPIV